ncbi:MAG: hypothetical protein IPI06_09915 [Gammaproteobacteria bacterium]|nr:hypothetical protein [Gammaproteobacteria bacterium]
MVRRLFAFLCLMPLAADIGAAPLVRDYLDETTAISVTYVTTPLVFVREHPSLGVNVREYLSLAPLELNAAGRETYYLFGYLWHTGAASGESLETLARELVILGDDRRMRLQGVGRSLRQAGLGGLPWPPPAPGAHPVMYSIDPEALYYLTATEALSVELPADRFEPLMSLWHDGRDGIREFLRTTVD